MGTAFGQSLFLCAGLCYNMLTMTNRGESAMTRQRAILNFLDELSSVNMHGFRLSLKGQVLAEGYWAPFCADEPHRLYSVSKSVTSLAIGLLADDGLIHLDAPITAYFPEWVDENTPAMLREVTIRNMLMMSTCFDRAMYSIDMDNWTKPFFYGQPTHPAGTLLDRKSVV